MDIKRVNSRGHKNADIYVDNKLLVSVNYQKSIIVKHNTTTNFKEKFDSWYIENILTLEEGAA